MRILMKVHGFVQGVGYRALVKRAAEKYMVNGYVRNLEDGSVEIYADAPLDAIESFEKEIRTNIKNGPVVMHIEKFDPKDMNLPEKLSVLRGFVVLH
ncbi:MAG: acylphosphatase [Candidatus Micrarchaeota archaeon]|nr:acylphosphatase [Candidatus Micrarchaeota archaeon]